MLNKFLTFFTVILFSICSVADDSKISLYVNDLVQKTFSILQNNNDSLSQKMKSSEELISKNMDLEWMSKFVLGKFRRTLSASQMSDFTAEYSEYVVKSYSSAVKYYKPNQTIKVLSQQLLNDKEYVVKTILNRPDQEPLHIDYMVRDKGNGVYRVFDVVTEGISLINSHQAEFVNMISNQGFDALIGDIKVKINSIDNSDERKQN